MEVNKSPEKIAEEIQIHLKNIESIPDEFKMPLINYTSNIINNKDKKVNIIFFGSMSNGKTTTINLLLECIKNCVTNSINSAPAPSEKSENNNNLNLPSSMVENTNCFTFIENSEDDSYHITFKINDERDKTCFLKSKEFKNENFNENNEIVKKYPNTEEGINNLQDFLYLIDDLSINLLEVIRKEHHSNGQLRIPPKIIINIPNFPKKIRIVDTPGLSIQNFADNFFKVVDEFNYINFYVIVRDILSIETYNMDDEILKKLNGDYGRPFLYSILTKGNSFVENYPEVTSSNKRDYDKYIQINKKFINSLKAFKYPNSFFRKLITLEDDVYSNHNVQNNLKYFWDDIQSALEQYGLSSYEHLINLKLRKYILDLNDKLESENQINLEDIHIIEKDNLVIREREFEKNTRDFMNKLSNYEDYKNNYPDHIVKINEIYKNNEYLVDIYWNRGEYIKKHAELAFQEFLKIILEGLNKIFMVSVSNIIEKIDKEVMNILNERLKDEGIINKFTNLNSSGSSGLTLIKLISTSSIFIPGSFLTRILSSTWVPVVGWIAGGIILVSGIVIGFNDNLGVWKKSNTRDDITKVLFQTFISNKIEIINKFSQVFSSFCKDFLNKLQSIKNKNDYTYSLLGIMDSFKQKIIESSDFDLKEEEFLEKIENEKLKNFFNRVLKNQEE